MDCLAPSIGSLMHATSSFRYIAIVITVFALIRPSSSAAQVTETTRGELIITVSHSTGARVTCALVLLTRGAERRTLTTGTDGIGRFAGLDPGEESSRRDRREARGGIAGCITVSTASTSRSCITSVHSGTSW